MAIRRAEARDVLAVAAIEKECFSHPWTIRGFRDALADSRAIFLVAEGGLADGIASAANGAPAGGVVASAEDGGAGEIVGYALLYLAADEGELVTIAVRKDCQRRGIGRALLQGICQEGRAQGMARAYLEVRQGNQAAKALYLRSGFQKVGVRPRFYEDPVEDADLMARDVGCRG